MVTRASQKRVAIIGFGAIGQDLHARLTAAGYEVSVVLRDGSASRATVPAGVRVFETIESCLAGGADLVVEAAGQEALRDAAPQVLSVGLSLIPASVGALEDAAFTQELVQLAARHGGRLIVPPGAIGGLDYLATLQGSADARVTYTSRKPPSAWRAELGSLGVDPDNLGGEVVLFAGSAAEAARLYPKNLNAGLTIALAVGAGRLSVKVIADPKVALNTHEITAVSSLGEAFLRFANRPSPANPKTSAITAASLAMVVRRIFDPLVI